MPATEAFCPECGAAMSHDQGSEGSDTAVYPELARANLLRMRGDYKAAEQQCLAILRRYPNNATANILLGDICAEKGDLDQSMQWYEMALDLAPESQAAQHKLESVKQRFKEKETAATVEQLGLPTTKSKAGVYAIALIAAVFIFAVVMYFAGQRVGESRNDNIIHGHNVQPIPPTPDPGPNGVVQNSQTRTDQELVKAIQSTGTEGGRVLDAMQDPRTHAVIVTFSVLQNEDPRPLAASIAQQAFQQVTEAPVVTLRGLRDGQVAYMADAMRSLYEETLAPSWTAGHQSDANAWIDHILTHEWPAQTPPPVVTPSVQGQTTTSGDTSSTTGDDSTTTSSNPPGDNSGTDNTSNTTTPKEGEKTTGTAGDQGATTAKPENQSTDTATTTGGTSDNQSDNSQPPGTTTGD